MTSSKTEFKRSFVQKLWYAWYRSMGWDAEYVEPGIDKYVIIVAPHTSNLDFLIGFIFSRAYPLPFPRFIAKKSAFVGPIGWLGRAVGGIPVDRTQRTNFVDQVAEQFNLHEQFVVAITPEGTRSKVTYWKSGFYHIARAAGVPIVMATIDYGKKQIRYGAVLYPSGDLDADMEKIRKFYEGATGRHPERQGAIEIQPPKSEK
ncbi:MAG: lysophospholipid acyltransferase family protein [Anaerolineales bacterium]|nr:lysophospholipid acyltransferase family protein [Anaerolineales bacterium]